jgi:hypothetical protein
LSEVDWSKVPDWATECGYFPKWSKGRLFFTDGHFYCYDDCMGKFEFDCKNCIPISMYKNNFKLVSSRSKYSAPLILEAVEALQSIIDRKTLEQAVSKLTSTMLLDEVKSIQLERAAEYEQDGGIAQQKEVTNTSTQWTAKHYDNLYQLTPEDIERGNIRIDPYFVNKLWKLNEKDNTGALFHNLKTIARFTDKNPVEREIKALYNQTKRMAELYGVVLEG